MDPIAAVTHSDPYPFYAELVRERPVYRDDALGLWVVSSAAAVADALTSDLCRVRPPTEPVPRPLIGTAAGDVFGRLVRQTDGPLHAARKPVVAAALGAVDPSRAAEVAAEAAEMLEREIAPATHPDRVMELAFRLSSYALAGLAGVARTDRPEIADRVGELVRGIAPSAPADGVARGGEAASRLLEITRGALANDDTLPGALTREARQARLSDTDALAANAVGFFTQAYEATAGLVGNTLIALARDAALHERVRSDEGILDAVLREVARHDSPVHNTRRFLARDGVVAGQSMREGDAILVVLAAANRDPAANPQPERFDPDRAAPRSFTFGLGPHACAGEALAVAIARAGVARLLTAGVDVQGLDVTYRPSPNTRVPLFSAGRPAAGTALS